MASHNRSWIVSTLSLLVVVAMLAGCGATATPTAAPTVAPTKAPPTAAPSAAPTKAPTAVPPTKAPPTATPVPPTATPKGPAVGGKLVLAMGVDIESLDPSRCGGASTMYTRFFGATLVARDPATKKFVPYLAASWTISPDGLTYDFVLRNDVKFHNGTPMTANDYAWTVNRTLEAKKSCAGAGWGGVLSAEALDDQTLRLKLAAANSYFLDGLNPWCSQPMSRAYVEQAGDAVVARQPVAVGPFKVKEWVTGDHLTLVRNSDFVWGPPYTHGGPPYIETLDFRLVFEPATILAGLEAGELDFARIDDVYAPQTAKLPNVELLKLPQVGEPWYLALNQTRPPLDDIRVRQAFNMIFDREALIKVVSPAGGLVAYGPLTPPTDGYCKDVETIGYKFDLAKAKMLLAEAGYTPGADGMLQKDGKPLAFEFKVFPPVEKTALTVQEQLKAAGVQAKLQVQETGIWYADVVKGNYDLTLSYYTIPNASALQKEYDSANIGGTNWTRQSDPELDKMLRAMMAATDASTRDQLACQAQKHIMQHAYDVPLYAGYTLAAKSKRVKGLVMGYVNAMVELFDAYIEQ